MDAYENFVPARIKKRHKRNDIEIKRDRSRIAELRMMGYSFADITRIINDEAGRVGDNAISDAQVRSDFYKVRDQWKDTQMESYNQYLNEELARIQASEKQLWSMLRDSANPKKRRTIVEAVRRLKLDEEEQIALEEEGASGVGGLTVKEVVTTIVESGADAAVMRLILELHKERRKLLGLYAPSATVNVNKTVVVKGYKKVSPDSWPEPESIVIEQDKEKS